MSNEVSASVKLQNIRKEDKTMFADNVFNDLLDNNKTLSLSFANFLARLSNNVVKDENDKWTNTYDLIQNDKRLLFNFIMNIKSILVKYPNVDMNYVFAIPRRSTIKKGNEKQTIITLQVGMQYQAQQQILSNFGYNFEIDYILEGDDFEEIKEINEKGEFMPKIKYTQHNEDLFTFSPDNLKEILQEQVYIDKVEEVYKKIRFAIVWIMKNNEKSTYMKISKYEMFSSLNASLFDYKGEAKECFKNRNGIKATLDIAIIHILYKRLILKSNEDEAEMCEAQQISQVEKGFKEVEPINSTFEEIVKKKNEEQDNQQGSNVVEGAKD